MEIPTDVIAAQFAGGRTVQQLACEWDLDMESIEAAVRHELRLLIPRWAGGLKPTRDEVKRMRSGAEQAAKMPWLPMISDL